VTPTGALLRLDVVRECRARWLQGLDSRVGEMFRCGGTIGSVDGLRQRLKWRYGQREFPETADAVRHTAGRWVHDTREPSRERAEASSLRRRKRRSEGAERRQRRTLGPHAVTEVRSISSLLPPRAALLRLQLKPEVSTPLHVDGAWWPWSRQLPVELASLLPTLSDRIGNGDIAMVSFDANVWDDAPANVTIEDNEIRLEGQHSHGANILTVLGTAGERLTLVVVPPDAATPAAVLSLNAASQADPPDAAADAAAQAMDEVVDLLARQDRSTDPERTTQIRRWVEDTADQFG
jgi:hypothetical protein